MSLRPSVSTSPCNQRRAASPTGESAPIARRLKRCRHHPPEGILRIISFPDVGDPQSEGGVDVRDTALPNVVPFRSARGAEKHPQPRLVLPGQLQVLDELPVDIERARQADPSPHGT